MKQELEETEEESQETLAQFGDTKLGEGLGCAAMIFAAGFGLAAILLAMKYSNS